jgi:NIMA (never in mitosis gene a)-related kinase
VFEEAMIWNYAEQITAGLQHMHAKRIMHRDLKPANIMLTMDNQIKLGDLGLGRYFTSQTLEAFSKVGTPLYMSAEVLQGNGYTFSADVRF